MAAIDFRFRPGRNGAPSRRRIPGLTRGEAEQALGYPRLLAGFVAFVQRRADARRQRRWLESLPERLLQDVGLEVGDRPARFERGPDGR